MFFLGLYRFRPIERLHSKMVLYSGGLAQLISTFFRKYAQAERDAVLSFGPIMIKEFVHHR